MATRRPILQSFADWVDPVARRRRVPEVPSTTEREAAVDWKSHPFLIARFVCSTLILAISMFGLVDAAKGLFGLDDKPKPPPTIEVSDVATPEEAEVVISRIAITTRDQFKDLVFGMCEEIEASDGTSEAVCDNDDADGDKKNGFMLVEVNWSGASTLRQFNVPDGYDATGDLTITLQAGDTTYIVREAMREVSSSQPVKEEVSQGSSSNEELRRESVRSDGLPDTGVGTTSQNIPGKVSITAIVTVVMLMLIVVFSERPRSHRPRRHSTE
jgi:hypothetical protein